MRPLVLSSYTTTSCVGKGIGALADALAGERSGLTPLDIAFAPDLDTYAGRVAGLEDSPIDGRLSRFDSRNNRLARMCVLQDGFEEAVWRAVERYGADRISLVIGTSTSGILETELAYRRSSLTDEKTLEHFREKLYYTHSFYSTADYIAEYFGLTGPVMSISTACSSSAKAFAAVARHISAGFADAGIAGGVDSLCMTTLYGFNSLNVVSATPCKPCDTNRDGLSLGEAAGFALLEKPESVDDDRRKILLTGYGESSDAHHMSAPHPQGAGVRLAMIGALERAGLSAGDIDYINMHGTATPANDTIEARAIMDIFGGDTPCSSTKGWTGHTLGAAGIVEAIIGAICLESGLIPACLNLERIDPDITINIARSTTRAKVGAVLINSFGFGGANCSVVMERG